MNVLRDFLSSIGAKAFDVIEETGRGGIFLFKALIKGARPPLYWRQFGRSIVEIGFLSLPLIALTALFTGMVLALQSYTAFSRFDAEQSIPEVVAISITRELGPVLSALMISGRLGASIAAEIGSMKVTEQLDALLTLSTSPFRYLIFPRLIAGMLMMPLLTAVADIIGIFGGFVVSVGKFHFYASQYLSQTLHIIQFNDVMSGLVKAVFFGFLVTFLGCYHGYVARRGAQGVGIATTRAVVSSSMMILFSNYLLTALLFS